MINYTLTFYESMFTKVNINNVRHSLPAHDFVCKEDSAHFGVFVLTFVDDGL